MVTWSQHAALGQPYRDFYITMRWSYAAWNWDGTSTAIDQAQFTWFAEKPRLVLVTNPRTGASIVAAALEAGPAPWVGRHEQRRNWCRHGPRLAGSHPRHPRRVHRDRQRVPAHRAGRPRRRHRAGPHRLRGPGRGRPDLPVGA